MKLVRALAQVLLLSALYLAFERGAAAVHSPVPGSVLGAIGLAALLLLDVVPLRWFEDGSKLLLDHLALFFVPAAVAATRSWGAVRRDLWAVSAIAVVTTVVVLAVVGRLAERDR